MLCFDRTDVSEGIDVNKTSASKEFQPDVCNRSHDLLMMSMNLRNISILNIKGSSYRCMISLISKDGTINLR